jgi:hypothetical protein
MVHVTDPVLLRQWRKQFPLLPLVSVAVVPPQLVDTIVVGDATETFTTIRDFFRKCGLSNMAVFRLASGGGSRPRGRDWVMGGAGGRNMILTPES